MGIAAEGELEHLFDFIYRAKVDKELTEYEYDRVFSLTSDEVPRPHPPDEVDEWRYVTSEALHEELRLYSGRFTEWFKLIFQRSAGT